MTFHSATSEEVILVREINAWLDQIERRIDDMIYDAEDYANGEAK